MYKTITVHDKVRVPPKMFGSTREEAIKKSLEEKWEGLIDKRLGVILSVIDVSNVGEGNILPGDGAIYYPADFELLVYHPEMHELVKGYVIDVTEFGIFIRVGPVDGMVHVSQIMDDFVSYDPKNAVFTGRDSKRILKEKDTVRARVISISMGSSQYKIGLTTRQSGLGVLGWFDIDKRKAAAKKPDGVEKSKGKADKPKPKGKK